MKILCVCLSTTIQRTVTFTNLELGKVNRSQEYRQDASGKAVNSARVLNQLEYGCCLTICPVGEKNQDIFIELAKKDHLNMSCVTIPGFTRECWTLLDSQKNTTTEIVSCEPEFNAPLEKEEIKLLKLISENLQNTDAVLLAGSRPKGWSNELCAAIAGIALDAKKIFLADIHGQDLLLTLKNCTPSIIKINDDEFCETFADGKKLTEAELQSAITEQSSKLKNKIVVTRGTKETFAADNGIFTTYPTEKIVPVNTTACGDSFNAGFLYEYIKTRNFESALKKGTWCAARNAELKCPGSTLASLTT